MESVATSSPLPGAASGSPRASLADSVLDWAALEATPLRRIPFDHLVVPGFIRASALPGLAADYPRIDDAGTYPIERLTLGPAFQAFWEELQGERMRAAFAGKFEIDLAEHPVMATMRERCEASDGAIHTDSRTKLLTLLFYFNESWPHASGRLRLLRSATDLDDYAAEVPPLAGTLLAFRPCDHSFHGHLPYEGHRRMLQMHWVDPKRAAKNERKRRTLRWRLKKALSLG